MHLEESWNQNSNKMKSKMRHEMHIAFRKIVTKFSRKILIFGRRVRMILSIPSDRSILWSNLLIE